MDNKELRPEWIPSAYIKELEKTSLNTCKDLLFGVAIGDALGVPVEFKSREEIGRQPVTDMIGHGTHNKPAGTFSDDSSLTFCLAEAIASGFTLEATAQNFINWRYKNYWTAAGEVFDIGITTQNAIERLVRAPSRILLEICPFPAMVMAL
jgi:ADP-ribosyl-[dinitrogen reductase] hydrolase